MPAIIFLFKLQHTTLVNDYRLHGPSHAYTWIKFKLPKSNAFIIVSGSEFFKHAGAGFGNGDREYSRAVFSRSSFFVIVPFLLFLKKGTAQIVPFRSVPSVLTMERDGRNGTIERKNRPFQIKIKIFPYKLLVSMPDHKIYINMNLKKLSD